MKEKSGIIMVLSGLVLLPIMSGWIGDIARELFNGERISPIDGGLFGIALLVAVLIVLFAYGYSKRLLPPRLISENSNPDHRAVLIAMLSENRGIKLDEKEDLVFDDGTQLPETLNAAISSKLPSFTWQQVLRAAQKHQPELEVIYLIASKNGSGTPESLKIAEKFFTKYFPGKVKIHGYVNGHSNLGCFPNFNLLEDVRLALGNVLRDAKKANYSDKRIMIDCTGGMKTTSIAAAFVTLDRPDLQFQYMGTGADTGSVLAYNLVTQKRYD
ncbi:MAG: hypothetical protein WCI39_13785 [Gallionellaceae bacterium]